MSNITDWIKAELYPSLFPSIDRAFPEHEFQQRRGDWQSKTYLTGAPHTRADKTVITRRAPGIILEQGGEVMSLVDYVMQRDGVEFIQAVKTLAEVAGVDLPKTDLDPLAYQKYRDQVTILEDCNSYFIYCLSNAKGADKVRSYLESRGYSEADISAMELGYIPSQDQLYKYLTTKGYSSEQVQAVVRLHKGIGSTHQLSIPYRSGGSLKGFKFRTIAGHQPKYYNTTGLDRLSGFFNLAGLKGDKDVVVVEGELDSLAATARGVDNVVATAGSSIGSEQVRDAIKRGAKSFTLCFDTEPGKEEETAKRVTSAIQVILAEGVSRVYIVTLPGLGGTKTDPDRLIKESGVETFKQAITEAQHYYEYLLEQTLYRYGKIEQERGLQPRDIDSLLDEVVQTAARIPDPTAKDRYSKLFTSLEAIQELGITSESLDITVDRLTSTKAKEEQEQALQDLLFKATQLQTKGETPEALKLLEAQVKAVKGKSKESEFSQLLVPTTEDQIKARQSTRPESLDSGYTIDSEEVLLPAGALSIFAAPTSHGKTTLLSNLALNICEKYPDKKVYLFSYEEDADSVLINTLNVYINEELSTNNRRSLRSYFASGSEEYIRREAQEYFRTKKQEFFTELIDTGRLCIQYLDYNSETLTEAIRYLHKTAEPGAILIDYFQLLNLPEGRLSNYASRQQELKEICINLKDLAVETGLPITLGAQFNREVITPQRIHATKIGEAGDIERIANVIVGFWNGNFKPGLPEVASEFQSAIALCKKGTFYTDILKNRTGRAGLQDFWNYNGNTGKITSNSPEQETSSNNPF